MHKIPYTLTREFIVAHPEWTFVYGTNFWENEWVGTAAVCKGLANCFSVPVRWRLCKSSGYFQDSAMEEIVKKIDVSIAAIPRDKPIICFPKLGNGRSGMYRFAPKAYAYLKKQLEEIETKVARDYQN